MEVLIAAALISQWQDGGTYNLPAGTVFLDPSDVYLSKEDIGQYMAAGDSPSPGEFITVIWVEAFEDIALAPDNHATFWVSLYEPMEE